MSRITNIHINRQKLGNQTEDSVLIQSLQHSYALEFERSDATRRLRLFLSELLTLTAQVGYQEKVNPSIIVFNVVFSE